MSWQTGLLVPLLEILVLAVGGLSLAAGRITAGELIAAAGYIRIALGLVSQMDAVTGIVSARACTARVAEVLAEQPARSLPSASQRRAGPGAVTLRGVTVHAGDRLILNRLDLDVPAGTAVAIVGRSGAGKTTLTSLIGGLTVPDEGTVLLDGVPVGALDPDQLRRAVAYAFERPNLLGSSVGEAIAYGRPTSSQAEIERAARAAQADGFIRRLPTGYHTPLACTPLSGGEAQRLGFARAINQDSRIMVLDDATSSLDTAIQVQVENALATLLTNRTCIVVAHRAATAARADLVAWLDGGRIRALAPHTALWDDPDYRCMFAASPTAADAARGNAG